MLEKTTDPYYVRLKNRGLIHIEGADRKNFLQGIITNDINTAAQGQILYSCLLTPQGKFLHDFFIHEGEDFLLLDCEGGERAQDLYKKLSIYKLRSDVQLSVETEHPVYALMNAQNVPANAIPDPRHPHMGYRSFEKPEGIEEQKFETWDAQRIALCVPDGSRDMIPDKALLLESHIDKLHGVAFDKGCYMGQEITARMHYRGLAKKHIYALKAANDAFPAQGADFTVNGSYIGTMLSQAGSYGLALLKDSAIETLPEAGFKIVASAPKL